MQRESLKEVLMRRDGLTEQEADDLIQEAREDFYARLEDGEMLFDLMEEWFGLEPDYLDDILFPKKSKGGQR